MCVVSRFMCVCLHARLPRLLAEKRLHMPEIFRTCHLIVACMVMGKQGYAAGGGYAYGAVSPYPGTACWGPA
jgi:hypothetical protein